MPAHSPNDRKEQRQTSVEWSSHQGKRGEERAGAGEHTCHMRGTARGYVEECREMRQMVRDYVKTEGLGH